MIYSAILFLGLMATLVLSIDIERLQTFPIPLDSVDLDRYGGYWYIQRRYGPCSWAGSKAFTDMVFRVRPRRNTFTIKSCWRQDGVPTDVTSVVIEKAPGTYQQKDSIGNVYTADWYLVDTDYKKYSVSYGCTKRSVTGDTCSDPYLSVETRHPKPDRYTLGKIDRMLRQRFGISLSEMICVQHKNPCVKVPAERSSDYSFLYKKY